MTGVRRSARAAESESREISQVEHTGDRGDNGRADVLAADRATIWY